MLHETVEPARAVLHHGDEQTSASQPGNLGCGESLLVADRRLSVSDVRTLISSPERTRSGMSRIGRIRPSGATCLRRRQSGFRLRVNWDKAWNLAHPTLSAHLGSRAGNMRSDVRFTPLVSIMLDLRRDFGDKAASDSDQRQVFPLMASDPRLCA
jgi:hypothetical protein